MKPLIIALVCLFFGCASSREMNVNALKAETVVAKNYTLVNEDGTFLGAIGTQITFSADAHGSQPLGKPALYFRDPAGKFWLMGGCFEDQEQNVSQAPKRGLILDAGYGDAGVSWFMCDQFMSASMDFAGGGISTRADEHGVTLELNAPGAKRPQDSSRPTIENGKLVVHLAEKSPPDSNDDDDDEDDDEDDDRSSQTVLKLQHDRDAHEVRVLDASGKVLWSVPWSPK